MVKCPHCGKKIDIGKRHYLKLSDRDSRGMIQIKNIINYLTDKLGYSVPLEEVLAKASERKNIDENLIEKNIERLKEQGVIFEPRRGFIQII